MRVWSWWRLQHRGYGAGGDGKQELVVTGAGGDFGDD